MSHIVSSISYHELCKSEDIEDEFVMAIVEYGIVEPTKIAPREDWEFEASSVYWIKKASRLRVDLEIDWVAVAMVIDLMRQKDTLEKENIRMNRLLERFIEGD